MAHAVRLVVAVLGPQTENKVVERMAGVVRDLGVEVICAGTGSPITSLVAAVVQEDADALALVISDDGQCPSVLELLRLLRLECGERVRVVVKGGLSPFSRAELHDQGVSLILGPDDPPESVLQVVKPAPQRGE